jgi:hypothetical protein
MSAPRTDLNIRICPPIKWTASHTGWGFLQGLGGDMSPRVACSLLYRDTIPNTLRHVAQGKTNPEAAIRA